MAVASMVLLSMAAGCKDGDSNTNADANPDPQVNPVVGTWLVTRITVDGDDLELGNYEMILTINADGTYTRIEDGDAAEAGTWSTQGTALTISDQSSGTDFYTYGVSGSIFTMSGEQGGSAVYYEFTRQ
jgi:hypothetical protein